MPETSPHGAPCDCHLHIVGPAQQYPAVETKLNPRLSPLADYAAATAGTGLRRCVVVQPSFYGFDNRCTLDAVQDFGAGARAVVVVPPTVSADELARLHARGARGVRFNIVSGGLHFDSLAAIAERIRPLGWHIQLFLDSDLLPQWDAELRRLSVPLVFDHLAHVRPSSSTGDEGFQCLAALLADGLAWTKVSNAFFPVCGVRAQALYAANRERVVWGSDWPNVVFDGPAPSVQQQLDALSAWLPDAQDRHRVLVRNPDALYFS